MCRSTAYDRIELASHGIEFEVSDYGPMRAIINTTAHVYGESLLSGCGIRDEHLAGLITKFKLKVIPEHWPDQ